jgi:hypothetical protein
MSRWIGAAVGLASGLGIVVGAGAYAAAASPPPKFSSGASRYDTSTFGGYVARAWHATDVIRFQPLISATLPLLLYSSTLAGATRRFSRPWTHRHCSPRTMQFALPWPLLTRTRAETRPPRLTRSSGPRTNSSAAQCTPTRASSFHAPCAWRDTVWSKSRFFDTESFGTC